MNNKSCNQLKVVPELEFPAPRGKEWHSGVGNSRAAGSMIFYIQNKKCGYRLTLPVVL